MIIAPIYLALMLYEFNHHFLVAAIVFGLASITDFFDGMLARKYNQITVFGKLFDPVGDKMLFLAAIIASYKLGLCSPWVIMIVISREFVITSLRMVAVEQGKVIAASMWGKVKTACQMVFTVVVMVLAEFSIITEKLPFSLEQISNVLMWIVAALTLISGIKYYIDAKKTLNITK